MICWSLHLPNKSHSQLNIHHPLDKRVGTTLVVDGLEANPALCYGSSVLIRKTCSCISSKYQRWRGSKPSCRFQPWNIQYPHFWPHEDDFFKSRQLQSASTEERLGGDFLLMNSCVGVLFEADKIQPHKTKSRDIGYSMTEIDRKHFNLQLHTKYSTTIFTDQKLLAPKVRAYR